MQWHLSTFIKNTKKELNTVRMSFSQDDRFDRIMIGIVKNKKTMQ
jgi:hypothetical protein